MRLYSRGIGISGRKPAPTVVLDQVSLDVSPGSLTGIVGPNGVGKSTLLRILAGSESPDGGSVAPLEQAVVERDGFRSGRLTTHDRRFLETFAATRTLALEASPQTTTLAGR